jgi:hypothetical protein
MSSRVVFFVFALFLQVGIVSAQTNWDSSYVAEDADVLVIRNYLSRKYTSLHFPSEDLRYQPNSGLNAGLGFTYQKLTLNLAFPPAFLNRGRERDFPRFLDLQGHFYPVHWMVDFFGQFYNGYRLPEGLGSGTPYLRPDLELLKLGVNVNYLFAGDKISLNAAMHQSYIQKKSAISPMIGVEMYRVQLSADSLLLPEALGASDNYQQADFFHAGPNLGLLGTVVFGKGFFATGAFSGNLGLGTAWNQDPLRENGNWKLSWGYHARAYLGYNGPRFGMNVNYIHKNLILPTFGNLTQEVYTGNYRFVLVYKIHPAQKFASSFAKYNPTRIFQK